MHIISKRGSADNVLTYEHICDTTADMTTIEPKYITLGSVCIVLQGSSGAMEVYMADSNKQWRDIMTVSSGNSSSGGETAGLSLYICTQAEVLNGKPNVSTPTEGVLYLVPSGNTSGNLYDEFVYVNDTWELFGGASVNLEGYATQDWVSQQGYLTSHQDISGKANSADLALKAAKTDTVLETTLSRGRKDNTTAGGASLAFGVDTEASGYYSVALGLNTTASSQGAYAEGKNTVAHYIAHAEGEDSQALGSWSHAQNLNTIANGGASSASGRHTIANGADSFVFGRYNAADSYDNWPTWTANTSYEVGDRVKRNLMVQNEPTDVGYHCTVANSDATFDSAHWELDGYHMNYVEIVGNGKEYEDPETHQSVRAGSNAYALEWNGTAHYAGNVYVGANPDSTGGVKVATVNQIPTLVSQLTNDSGYLTSFTETDPTVPSWAKAAQKPTYTAQEVGALPANTVIPTVPTTVSSFTNDAGYVTENDITATLQEEGATQIAAIDAEGEEIITSVKMLRYDIAEYDSRQTGKMFFKNTEALATVSNGYVKKYTIEPNVAYYFSSSGRASDSGFYFINYFDSNDTYLSSEYGIHSAGEDHDFTVLNIPNNAAWFYVNGRAEEPEVYIDSTPNKSLAQVIQEVNKLNNKELKTISILFVGNSLTQDSISYLPYMLVNYYPEVDFKFYIWYNGGYTLAQQYAKFTGDTACESFSIAENTANWTTSTAKMSDVLTTYEFDIVCMQEYFNYKETYVETDLADWNNCRDYIQSHYTGGNALKFISLLHAPLRSSAETVYSLTKAGNALILQKTIAEDIIPVGIAIHRALSTTLDSLGDSGHLSPDGTHTQEGLPCLLQTYVVLQWVLDKLSIPKSIYGSPMRMTADIYASINVPGANLGTGLIVGTDAQNLLAQEVAIQAYKEGKWFVMQNLSNAN